MHRERNASRVRLRVTGDDLDPDAISAALECVADEAWRKGDIMVDPSTGEPPRAAGSQPIRQRFGCWSIGTLSEPADVAGQMRDLLGRSTSDPAVWAELEKHYRICFFIGFFMRTWNEGIVLPPDVLADTAARGLLLDIDIYAELEGEESE